jgi:hopanoid biosynthesis associated protein HpnK
VTADDFGVSEDVNAAVLEAHRDGIVTAASLMVTGAARREAVALARANQGPSVGLHLVLVDGSAVLPAREIPHLVTPDGTFEKSPLRAGLRYQFLHAARSELRREIRAQLDCFRRTGLRLSHVDGHHHLHLHPIVLGILADLAPEFAISEIRLPEEELGTALALDRRQAFRKIVWSAIFRGLRRHGERRLRAAGVRHSDRVYGLLATGRIDEDYLLSLIPRMRGERVELYAHPSRSPAGSGPRELAALLSRRVKEAVSASGFAS